MLLEVGTLGGFKLSAPPFVKTNTACRRKTRVVAVDHVARSGFQAQHRWIERKPKSLADDPTDGGRITCEVFVSDDEALGRR